MMAKLVLWVLCVLFALVLHGVTGLSDQYVYNVLENIRDSSRSSGSTQFAGARLLDRNYATLYEDIRTFPETTPSHVEAYYLNDATFLSHLSGAAYLFIYTKNSPCVSSQASNRVGRTSCTLQIANLARQQSNLKVYVGFQIWYGKGNRFAPASTKEQEFRAEACQNKPTNLSYMYMPRGRNYEIVSC